MSEARPDDDRDWSYVATIDCGCTVAACIDEPRFAKDTAKFVADHVAKGYPVTRVRTTEMPPWVIHWPHDHDAGSAPQDDDTEGRADA